MNKVKDIIKEKEVSLQELADNLDVSRSAILKMLVDNPSQETLGRIALALTVPMWQLFASSDQVHLPEGYNWYHVPSSR